MAGIDYSIPGQIKSIQLESPMNAMAQAMQLRGLHEASQLNNLRLQEAQREQESTAAINAAYQKAYNPATGEVDTNVLRQSIASGGFGAKIPGIEKSLAETRKEQLAQQKHLVDLEKAKFEQSRQFLEGIDPNSPNAAQQYLAWHEANHADPVLGKMLAARGVTKDSAKAQIDEAISTGRLADLINQSKLGMEKFTQHMPAFNKENREQLNQDYSNYINSLPAGQRAVNITEFKAMRGQPAAVAPVATSAPDATAPAAAAPAAAAPAAAAPAAAAPVVKAPVVAPNVDIETLKQNAFKTPSIVKPKVTAPATADEYIAANANSKEAKLTKIENLTKSKLPEDQAQAKLLQDRLNLDQTNETKLSDIAQLQDDRKRAIANGDKKAANELSGRINKLIKDEGPPVTPVQLDLISKAIAEGRLAPDKVNSRNMALIANTLERNPTVNLKELNIDSSSAMAASKALATQSAKILAASTEANDMIPIVRNASAKVDRSKYPNLNSITNAIAKGTGGPEIVKLNTAINALVNSYARAINPTGVATVSDKNHARDVINSAYSQGQIEVILQTMQEEMTASKAAPGKAAAELKAGRNAPATNPNRRPLADILK
jgi:hypothetical protein